MKNPYTRHNPCPQVYSFIFIALTLLGATSCQSGTENHSAASDLISAFENGCSLNGNYLQAALNQTQSLALTIEDLQKNNSCAGVSGALTTIQNLSSQIASVNSNSYASQVSNLASVQKTLMLQLGSSTDPTVTYELGSAYGINLLYMAEAQASMVSTKGSQAQTPLQTGSLQMQGYVAQLASNQSNLLQCAQDSPALAAQLGAGMLAVAGSFTPTVAGTALSLAGNMISSALTFASNASYTDSLKDLDQIGMTTALPCGLEQMTDIYCQAQDIMDITHLEECSYNMSAPGCVPPPVRAEGVVSTSQFWQGLDVMERQLPALQLWINQAVTGITPSNSYAAQGMNDPATAVSILDDVARLAQGVMKSEEVKIGALKSPADQMKELENGLTTLTSVLAYESISTGCGGFSGGSGCTATAILAGEGSATQILLDLVGQTPALYPGCNPASILGSSCPNANGLNFSGFAAETPIQIWQFIEANAGGLPNSNVSGLALIDTTRSRQLALEHQQLNTDPSDLLLKVNEPAGEGLPSPVKALEQVDAFLKASQAYFADVKQVPDSLLDGGAAMRAGVLGLLADSDRMITAVITALSNMNGTNDLDTLTSIYNTLQLAKDRNFIYNRLLDQIKLDVHTRIISGQVPSNIYDILSQSEVDPTLGLTQIAPEQMETTLASLGQAQTTAQLNVQTFAKVFGQNFSGVLTLLKTQADTNGEPMNANPRTSPNRAAQARVCMLLASSQNQWPQTIDPKLCQGVSYVSELTGQSLSFDLFYDQLTKGTTKAPQRMCTFYRFYRTSENFVHEKQQSK